MSLSVEKQLRLWFYFCGFNFEIVAALFVAFFGCLLGRWRGMLAAWIGIAAYAVLAGASASEVRAVIVGGRYGSAVGGGKPHIAAYRPKRLD